jgi:hypothetical protein
LNARTSENEITDTIERLVPGKLIGPTERRIHDAVGVEYTKRVDIEVDAPAQRPGTSLTIGNEARK